MLEHTKERTTKGDAEIRVTLSATKAEAIRTAIANFLDAAGIEYRIGVAKEVEGKSRPWREVYPEANPGLMLQGARHREELTQADLAERIGVKRHHISEMEHDKRPIGKEMAKRLAKVLGVGYRVFL